MSELNYGDKVENLLYELSQYYEDEIKGLFEIRGEDENGVEGYEYIEVSLLADDAMKLIAELKAQRDAMAAENAALLTACRSLAEECAQTAGEADLVMEDIKTPATDAYLNSVRAEGVDMVLSLYESERHLVDDEAIPQYDFALSHLKLMSAKLRAGEPS